MRGDLDKVQAQTMCIWGQGVPGRGAARAKVMRRQLACLSSCKGAHVAGTQKMGGKEGSLGPENAGPHRSQ